MYHILKHLFEKYDVTVAGFREFGDAELFQSTFPGLQESMHFISRGKVRHRRLLQLYSLFTSHSYWYNWARSDKLEADLNRMLARDSYDIVLAEFASMGHFRLETDAIQILDAHNVEYDNFRRMSRLEWSGIRKKFYLREYRKSYREEVAAFNRHDAIFTTSVRDGNLIKKDAPAVPQFVIPNGVDMSYFHPDGSDAEPYSMIFTGTMNYVPNYDGMIYFLDRIFPLIKETIPVAKITIVGSNPPPVLTGYESDSVIITGFVDDVRPFVNRAGIYVVPINMGSGTRLKVVEALSMKKPIVSTSIGCEGIDTVDNEHLLIRDKPRAFAEAVIQLMKDRKLGNRLVRSGYELVKQKYDWNVIGHSIDKAFNRLMANREAILDRKNPDGAHLILKKGKNGILH